MAFNHLKRAAAKMALKADQAKARGMANLMTACTKENIEKAHAKAQPAILGITTAATAGSALMGASAAGHSDQITTAQMLVKNTCNVIGAICIAAAIVFFIWGFVGIGISNASDGGGQEKEKAQKKIVGAIAVLIVGAALIAGKGALAKQIKSAGSWDS